MKSKCFKLIFLVLISLSTTIGAQESPKNTRDETQESKKIKREMPDKWYKLMGLLRTEIKAIRSIKPLSPRLSQRLIELYTEQMSLVKERENKRFLEADPNVRNSKDKKDFFKTSRRLKGQIERMALRQIKAFPRFIGNAEIYHTLALNSRDYGDNRKTERYLLAGLQRAPQNSSVIYQSQTALAEHYYNEKNYERAILYYQAILKNKSDEWRSKHLYNAAWCYLKVQEYDDAIKHLMESFRLSQTNRAVSMEDQILDSAGAFFVLSRRVNEGLNFYLSNVKEPTSYLLKLSKRVGESIGFEKAEEVLLAALKEAKARDNSEHQMDVQLARLEIYREFKLYDRHFVTAQEIEKLDQNHEISTEKIEQSVQMLKEVVGYLQIRLSKNAKIQQRDYDPALLRSIHDYFDILVSLDQENKDEYFYFKAESSFAVSQYSQAADFYRVALEEAKDKKEREELKRKILNALLSTLEYAKFDKEKNDELSLYTYSYHVKFWPIDEKSRVIYRSLFNLLFQKGSLEKAQKTMELYAQNYSGPSDLKIQQGMLTQLIDHSIEKKQIPTLAAWVNRLNTGYLRIEPSYIEKATLILGQLLFESYDKLVKEGKRQQAIEGYLEVYKDERYPQKIKADASFLLAKNYADMGDYEKSYEWTKIHFTHAKKSDLKDRTAELYNLHVAYYQGQDFKTSTTLALEIIKHFCKDQFPQKKNLYSHIVYFSLLESEHQRAFSSLKIPEQCPIETKSKDQQLIESTLIGLLDFYKENREWAFFLKYADYYFKKGPEPKVAASIGSGLIDFYWDAHFRDNNAQSQHALKLLKSYNSPHFSKQVTRDKNDILMYHELMPEIEEFKLGSFTVSDPFEDQVFNQELEKSAAQLEKITQKVEKIINTGIPEYMLKASDKISKLYAQFATQIRSYVPRSQPTEFIESFQASMLPLAKGLQDKGHQYFMNTKKTIQQTQLISARNDFLLSPEIQQRDYNYRYMASEQTFPIDKPHNYALREGQQNNGGQQ